MKRRKKRKRERGKAGQKRKMNRKREEDRMHERKGKEKRGSEGRLYIDLNRDTETQALTCNLSLNVFQTTSNTCQDSAFPFQ